VAWIFFRAENIGHAISYLSGIFSFTLFAVPVFAGRRDAAVALVFVAAFLVIEWCGREQRYAIEKMGRNYPRCFRWSLYSVIIFIIGMYRQTDETPFLYFQF